MLRSNTWIIEAGGDAVRLDHLAVLILQEIGERAMQYPRASGHQSRGMFTARDPAASGLYPNQPDRLIRGERREQTYRIAASSHTGHCEIRQTSKRFETLRTGFTPYYRLKISHHSWIGVRAYRRSNQVVGTFYIGHPVSNRLIDGVFQSPATGSNRVDLCTEQLHAKDVMRLAADIFFPHIDDALQS